MSRQNHLYVNLDKNLVKIVDLCVSNIFSNGVQVYENRKDFITKSILNQLDKEKIVNPEVDNIIRKGLEPALVAKVGGNRILVEAKQQQHKNNR